MTRLIGNLSDEAIEGVTLLAKGMEVKTEQVILK